MLCYVMLFSVMYCSVVSWYVVMCCVVFCSVALYYDMFCCVEGCHVVLDMLYLYRVDLCAIRR